MIATKEFATGVPNIEEWNRQELGHFFEGCIFYMCKASMGYRRCKKFSQTRITPIFLSDRFYSIKSMFAKSKKPLVLIINDNVADLISEIQSLSSRKRIKNTVVALQKQNVDEILEDIKRSKSEGEWLICNCIDVDNGLVDKILNELRTDSHNINENFRMWICSLWNKYEEQPTLPTALLLHSEQYLREGAKDFEAQLKSILKSHYIRDAYGHIDNLQWKKVIYSVSLFHSIVVNKNCNQWLSRWN